jgi:hypothetical protein
MRNAAQGCLKLLYLSTGVGRRQSNPVIGIMAKNHHKNLPQKCGDFQTPGSHLFAQFLKWLARNGMRLDRNFHFRLYRTDTSKGSDREKSFPAGVAAVCRNMRSPEGGGIPSFYMPCGDMLQVKIAAAAAMDKKQERERHRPGVEPQAASDAAPRAQPRHAENVILHGPPL